MSNTVPSTAVPALLARTAHALAGGDVDVALALLVRASVRATVTRALFVAVEQDLDDSGSLRDYAAIEILAGIARGDAAALRDAAGRLAKALEVVTLRDAVFASGDSDDLADEIYLRAEREELAADAA